MKKLRFITRLNLQEMEYFEKLKKNGRVVWLSERKVAEITKMEKY